MNKTSRTGVAAFLLAGAACVSGFAEAQQQPPGAAAADPGRVQLDQLGNLEKGVPFPSDRGDITGDRLILDADAYGFTLPRDPRKRFCAHSKSRFVVTEKSYVKFTDLPDDTPQGEAGGKAKAAGTVSGSPQAHITCAPDSEMVVEDTLYVADDETQKTMSFERTGFAFGTLVVPFKFRLGGDRKLVSSSTIAPYFGFRHRKLQGYSLDLMPVVSAGLGIVPVYDPAKNDDDTKAAFSAAIGLTLTSSKNAKFNAGILIGKDFLSREDRSLDPSVNKVWLSLWLGLSY